MRKFILPFLALGFLIGCASQEPEIMPAPNEPVIVPGGYYQFCETQPESILCEQE